MHFDAAQQVMGPGALDDLSALLMAVIEVSLSCWEG